MSDLSKRRFLQLTAASVAALTLSACGGGDDDPHDVVEVIRSDKNLSVLAEALDAAGLSATLRTGGPYTVFAPTNDAFTALLAELGVSKAALFADSTLLTAVLTYHVLGARVKAADIPFGKAITTVEGDIFKISSGANPFITDGRNRTANITATDRDGGNGVIHVIDKVILPANKDIVATAQGISDFTTLVSAVAAAGLVTTLQGTGPFTVFAPTNAAFAAALAELNVDANTLFADTALLTRILTYHVVPGRVLKADVPVGSPITTAQGDTFTVNANLQITDQVGRSANISATDVLTSNGVIHVIDKVILPTGVIV